MRKQIDWTETAKRDVRSIDRATAIDILRKLDRFVSDGEGDVKRLVGIEPAEYRLRVGDYRVRFNDLGETLLILAVKHRSQVYR